MLLGASLLVSTLMVCRPAGAVVGPSHDPTGSLADSLVMVLQRQGPAAGFCTGIVIGPKAVLTAAHCVPNGADLRIHFKGANGAPVLLPVARVVRHPGYRVDAVESRRRSIDLAVVTLNEPLPGRFRPAVIGDPGRVEAGTRFRVAGFGLAREGEASSSGRLRETTLEARLPLSRLLLWATDPQTQGAGACTGDSGGPFMAEAGSAVVALTLWASGHGPRQCGDVTQAIWLAPYRVWIAEALAP